MKIEITSFSSHKTSKIVALMFAILTVPFMLMGILGFLFAPEMKTHDSETIPNFPFLFFAMAPIFTAFCFILFYESSNTVRI